MGVGHLEQPYEETYVERNEDLQPITREELRLLERHSLLGRKS